MVCNGYMKSWEKPNVIRNMIMNTTYPIGLPLNNPIYGIPWYYMQSLGDNPIMK